jgi:hypothetical protein
MRVGAAGEVEGEKAGKAGILFGNFVFLRLRSDSGMNKQGDVDLYLHGDDSPGC